MSSRPTARPSIRAPANVSEGRAGPAAHSAAEIADELSAWAVGGGIITAAVFPLALPILALTAVAMLPFLAVPSPSRSPPCSSRCRPLTVRSLVRRARAMAGTARAAGQAPAPAQRGG
jgi:hypothetical protein